MIPKDPVIDAVWFTPRATIIGTGLLMVPFCVGIVAFKSYIPDNDLENYQWKVYIGYGIGNDGDDDALSIIQTGVPFGSAPAAFALFPQLDQEKYRS